MCSEWQVLNELFLPLLGRLGFLFLCELNPIYRYSLLFKISALPSYDLDKHKPITNPENTLSFPLVLKVCHLKKKKFIYWFYLLDSRENASKENVGALTMFVCYGMCYILVTWSGHYLRPW